jgi:thiol-disulfide isomerase/thioredoxin
MKLENFLIAVLCAFSLNTFCQEDKTGQFKTLSIGDHVSNLTIDNIVNYKTKSARLSDFKGKLLILDFWSTKCTPCVAELPKMDSLQHQFAKNVVILPVSTEKSEPVIDLLNRRHLNLPSVVKDKLLTKIFPQNALGLHVWIDEKGKVINTTDGHEVTAKNIGDYLTTGKLSVVTRYDDVSFDPGKLLFVNGNGGPDDSFYARSIFSNKKLKGVSSSMSGVQYYPEVNGMQMVKSVEAHNSTWIILFNMVLNRGNRKGPFRYPYIYMETAEGKIEPIVQSPAHYTEVSKAINNFTETGEAFTGPHSSEVINYQMTCPFPGEPDNLVFGKYILEDINRYFNFTARLEKQKLSSWIIVKANNGKTPLAQINDTTALKHIYDNADDDYLDSVKNRPLKDFISLFMSHAYYLPPPIFNETGYENEKVNLDLHVKYNKDEANYQPMNLQEWRHALLKNGLDIKVEDREIEVIVLKKKIEVQ